MGDRSSTEKRLRLAEKKAAVLKTRLSGKTWAETAEIHGYAHKKGPWQLVHSTIVSIYKKSAIQYMETTLARLEQLLGAVWDPAMSGDVYAHEQARKIIADQRKMLGIDRPVRQEVSGPEGGPMLISAADLEKKLSAIRERNS